MDKARRGKQRQKCVKDGEDRIGKTRRYEQSRG
jgi:hypothetical protein